jgi:uncharacterized iron-regulated membrane protein
MRQLFRVTHKWLGIAITLPLLVIGVTGAAMVWIKPAPRLHLLHAGEPTMLWSTVVNVVTALSVLLLAGGVYLWWRRRSFRIDRTRGPWRFMWDMHQAFGAAAAVVMLVIALTGLGLFATRDISRRLGLPRTDPTYPTRNERVVRRLIHDAHTSGVLKFPLGPVWSIASLGFALQGLTGIYTWLRRPPKE